MIDNSNYTYPKDKFFPCSDQGLLGGGAGSLSNDKIKSCKICAADGFPHKPIIFRKITTTQASSNDQKEIFWTTEAMVDELFICLAKSTEYVTDAKNKGKQVAVRKYYRQAYELFYKIPVWKPSPTFVIDICDLTPEIKAELNQIAESADSKALRYVLTQSVGRLFENLNSQYYHLSIAKNLKVVLQK